MGRGCNGFLQKPFHLENSPGKSGRCWMRFFQRPSGQPRRCRPRRCNGISPRGHPFCHAMEKVWVTTVLVFFDDLFVVEAVSLNVVAGLRLRNFLPPCAQIPELSRRIESRCTKIFPPVVLIDHPRSSRPCSCCVSSKLTTMSILFTFPVPENNRNRCRTRH